MAHLRLNLSGLKGPACQRKIERGVGGLPGVWAAVVCLDQSYMDVEYADDNGPDAEALIAAVRKAGYSARIGG
jgi:cation transport ATPase